MSEQADEPPCGELSGSTQDRGADAHDSDDEPMVYRTPRDYATWARERRDRLIAEGAAPDTVILQSEVPSHVPRRRNESPADYAKRYAETTNAMIRRGVSILNDQCVADVVPSGFRTRDGRYFDLGPRSGATKGDFREFNKWFSEASNASKAGQSLETPERWLKFEKPAKENIRS